MIPFIKNTDLTYYPSGDAESESISDVLSKFESWLVNSDLKQSTKKVYLSRLRQFERFIRFRKSMSVDNKELWVLANAFLETAKGEDLLKANSMNNFITMFKMVAQVAGIEDFYLQRQAPENKKRPVLTNIEKERYMEVARKSPRDLLLVLILLQSNIRIGEAIELKVSDLSWEQGRLAISIRRRQARRIEVMSLPVQEAMQVWLHERSRLPAAQKSEYLFPGATGGKITNSAIDAAIRKVGWKSGLNVCARVLRNTYLAR